MSSYCYILYSVKLDKYYVGSTNDLERRMTEHNRGKERFTKTGSPWKLVYQEKFDELILARRRELAIKKMKSRTSIQKLISGVG
ncbi:GIY-YIG nuclease family protein [Pollutibacter soli]|uniref:GIY-YIG nuclease family protein n=1 Tax=Pollutibacter soli TaxID=3034157 RepID=UPI003013B40B